MFSTMAEAFIMIFTHQQLVDGKPKVSLLPTLQVGDGWLGLPHGEL